MSHPVNYTQLMSAVFCGGNEYYLLPGSEASCNISPAIDGKFSTCYDIPIPLPMCVTSNYGNLSGPNVFFTTTTYRQLDINYLWSLARLITMFATGLGISTLTILNILVLTPNHKRRLPLHNLLVAGLILLTANLACRLYIYSTGALSSSYLWLTNDWASSSYSVTSRATEFTACFCDAAAFLILQVLFFIQARSLLIWVKVLYRRWIYHVVLYLFAMLGVLAWIYRCIMAGMRIKAFALVRNFDWPIPDEITYSLTASKGNLLFGISIVLWSLCNMVTVGRILWERRRLFSRGMAIGSDDSMKPLRPGLGRVANAYEKALWLIGVVGAQSFVVPLILCVYSLSTYALLDPVIIPVVYGLMPMSSLFVETKVKQEAVKDSQQHEFMMERNVNIKESSALSYDRNEAFAELPGH